MPLLLPEPLHQKLLIPLENRRQIPPAGHLPNLQAKGLLNHSSASVRRKKQPADDSRNSSSGAHKPQPRPTKHRRRRTKSLHRNSDVARDVGAHGANLALAARCKSGLTIAKCCLMHWPRGAHNGGSAILRFWCSSICCNGHVCRHLAEACLVWALITVTCYAGQALIGTAHRPHRPRPTSNSGAGAISLGFCSAMFVSGIRLGLFRRALECQASLPDRTSFPVLQGADPFCFAMCAIRDHRLGGCAVR